MGPEDSPGEYTKKLKTWLWDIVYGNESSHKWAVVIPEKQGRAAESELEKA